MCRLMNVIDAVLFQGACVNISLTCYLSCAVLVCSEETKVWRVFYLLSAVSSFRNSTPTLTHEPLLPCVFFYKVCWQMIRTVLACESQMLQIVLPHAKPVPMMLGRVPGCCYVVAKVLWVVSSVLCCSFILNDCTQLVNWLKWTIKMFEMYI